MSNKEKLQPEEIDWTKYPNCYLLLKDLILASTIEVKPVPDLPENIEGLNAEF